MGALSITGAISTPDSSTDKSCTTECHAMVCGRAVCAADSFVCTDDDCTVALQASGGEFGAVRGAGGGSCAGACAAGGVGAACWGTSLMGDTPQSSSRDVRSFRRSCKIGTGRGNRFALDSLRSLTEVLGRAVEGREGSVPRSVRELPLGRLPSCCGSLVRSPLVRSLRAARSFFPSTLRRASFFSRLSTLFRISRCSGLRGQGAFSLSLFFSRG